VKVCQGFITVTMAAIAFGTVKLLTMPKTISNNKGKGNGCLPLGFP